MVISIVTIPIYESSGRASKVQCTSTTADAATVAALANAIKGSALVLGMVGVAKFSTSAENTPDVDLSAAPEGAQRGQRLLVKGTAAVTLVRHTMEIPCFDALGTDAAGSDVVTVPAGIKSAIEALWTDASGNAITCDTLGVFVNRNVN